MSMVPTTAAIMSDLRTTGQLNAIAIEEEEEEVIQVIQTGSQNFDNLPGVSRRRTDSYSAPI